MIPHRRIAAILVLTVADRPTGRLAFTEGICRRRTSWSCFHGGTGDDPRGFRPSVLLILTPPVDLRLMIRVRTIARILGQSLLVLAVAAAVYLALGWVALGAMYRAYGGSGHPPAPAAPNEVYFAVFVVLLPLLGLGCGLGGLWLLKLLSRWLRARRSAAS